MNTFWSAVIGCCMVFIFAGGWVLYTKDKHPEWRDVRKRWLYHAYLRQFCVGYLAATSLFLLAVLGGISPLESSRSSIIGFLVMAAVFYLASLIVSPRYRTRRQFFRGILRAAALAKKYDAYAEELRIPRNLAGNCAMFALQMRLIGEKAQPAYVHPDKQLIIHTVFTATTYQPGKPPSEALGAAVDEAYRAWTRPPSSSERRKALRAV